MNLIETYKHENPGYAPVVIGQKWQVAFLNYSDNETLESIDKLDVHHRTDETFTLLQGRSVLIAAEVKGDTTANSDPQEADPNNTTMLFETIDMLPHRVYNIPKGVWHKIAMYPGSQVLITENNNTHIDDFEFLPLSDEQKEALREQVNRCIG